MRLFTNGAVYGGMDASEAKRLRELELVNFKLEITLLYDGMLDWMVGRLASVGIPEERDIFDLAFPTLYEEQVCVVEGTGGKLIRRRRMPRWHSANGCFIVAPQPFDVNLQMHSCVVA